MCKIIRQRWAVPDCNAGWVFQNCNTSLAMQDIISVQNGLCKIATQNGLHKKLCKYGGLCKIEMQDGLCNIAIHNGLCKTFVSCIGAKVGCVKNMGCATLQDESCRITMSSWLFSKSCACAWAVQDCNLRCSVQNMSAKMGRANYLCNSECNTVAVLLQGDTTHEMQHHWIKLWCNPLGFTLLVHLEGNTFQFWISHFWCMYCHDTNRIKMNKPIWKVKRKNRENRHLHSVTHSSFLYSWVKVSTSLYVHPFGQCCLHDSEQSALSLQLAFGSKTSVITLWPRASSNGVCPRAFFICGSAWCWRRNSTNRSLPKKQAKPNGVVVHSA